MKYLVVEIQKYPEGAVNTPTSAYDDILKAEAQYHKVLAAAAVSKLAVHSCVMLDENGSYIKSESFTHETTQEES